MEVMPEPWPSSIGSPAAKSGGLSKRDEGKITVPSTSRVRVS